MATGGISPSLAIRSGVGVELWSSTDSKHTYVPNQSFTRDESKFCRTIAFSPDGRYLAWSNGTKLQICNASNWKVIVSIPRKTFYIKFSPNGNYLSSWEVFVVNDGTPNLFIYKTDTGEELFSTITKKNTDWEPSWSNDESIMALMVGGEAFFYEVNGADGFKKSVNKIGGGRNGGLSLAPGSNSPFISFYVPGIKGAPSMCKIFKYPDLQAAQPIGCKSFFQADTVEMMWNKRGTGLILLTSTEIDTTGASYYGKQALHYMSTKGESFAINLTKEGPIHAVQWNPNSTEFCVVYGFMPAKASFFNLKCDSTFDFGEGSRNSIYYNPFGNLVILAGFGNLPGPVEIWDVAKKKQITSLKAPDTTLLEWCPNGETFVTATTAPRLRISNGFKVWHYSGALLHETFWPTGQELLEVVWQTFSTGTFTVKPISNVKIEGIVSKQAVASSQAYQPPSARGIKLAPPKVSQWARADDGKSIPGLAPQPASAAKAKKNNNKARSAQRRENAAARKSENIADTKAEANNVDSSIVPTATAATVEPINGTQQPPRKNGNNKTVAAKKPLTEEQEKVKRIKYLNKLVTDIGKWKERQKMGETLKPFQLSSLTSESDFIKELNSLKIT